MQYDKRPVPDDVKKLATLLDSRFATPFGLRIGWDGLLGLIPGVGDITTTVISFYVLYRGAQLGLPPSVLLRMGGNILLENMVDVIPIVGNLFDFFWKANLRNIKLIEQYSQNPRRVTWASRVLVWCTLIGIMAVTIGMIALAIYLIRSLFS